MSQFVALLRGVNVGGHNKVPMADLRRLAEGLGWTGVRSYIASGNLVFEAPAAEYHGQMLSSAMSRAFGVDVPVMVLSAERLRAACAACPYPPDAGKAVHLWFFDTAPDPDIDAIAAARDLSESFFINDLCAYLHAPSGIGRSKLASRMERTLGVRATARNLSTVTALVEMLDG